MPPRAADAAPTASRDLDGERQEPRAVGLERYGLTVRAVVLALLLTWLSGYWIRQSEIVALACQGTEAVPSIPGVGALLLVLMGNALVRRTRLGRPLQLPEIITVFLFVTVATTMFGCGIGRFLLACLSAPFYYSSPAAPLEKLARFIPPWLSPADPLVHKWLYESAPTGHVPWHAWQWPIVAWTGFFLMFGGMLLCLMMLFSERWGGEERLVFPLVRLPLQMIDPDYSEVPFFRSRAAWIGIGLATFLNVINIVRGVFMGGPSGGLAVDLGKQLIGAPWSALRPLNVHFRPELIGLGYLISTELSFSIWFFHMLSKLQALLITGLLGLRLPGAPYAQEQGIGAYVVLGAILFWKGRGPLVAGFRALIWGARAVSSPRAASYRWPLIGAVLGFVGAVAFCRAAGMEVWLAVLYLAVLTSVSVVYARLRAEAGAPLVWAYPYGLAHRAVKYFMNSSVYVGAGPDYRSATVFNLLIFMSRGYFPTVSGYGIEGVTLGEAARMRKSSVFWLLLAAIGVGALASFYFHLVPYCGRGAIGLRGGLWGSGEAQAQYASLWTAIKMPVPPDQPRIIATVSGGGFLTLLTLARARFFGSPFHPLGYAMACSYGELLWGPFLVTWIIKSVLLRYGGHKAYLAALPGFLGFALGHFVVAGAIWGSLGAALGGPFLRYGVWFG
ncbi:MAG: hypothetical protein FJX74_15790 [Armatimonadetes bacterium]|nr:hypothetical protein [Armatimonadota bacterium]